MSAATPDYYRVISTKCCGESITMHLGTYEACPCCGRIFHFTWAATIRMKDTNTVQDCTHHPQHAEIK